jgi:hypothetical protein
MADIVLPEPPTGYEYVLQPKRKERLVELRERRDFLQLELSTMVQPTVDELKDIGKQYSIYWQKSRELDMVKELIKNTV